MGSRFKETKLISAIDSPNRCDRQRHSEAIGQALGRDEVRKQAASLARVHAKARGVDRPAFMVGQLRQLFEVGFGDDQHGWAQAAVSHQPAYQQCVVVAETVRPNHDVDFANLAVWSGPSPELTDMRQRQGDERARRCLDRPMAGKRAADRGIAR